MAKNNSFLITKPEIKFWLAIIGLVTTGVVAFTTLKMEVNAIYDKGILLRKEVEADRELLYEINERTIRIEEKIDNILNK